MPAPAPTAGPRRRSLWQYLWPFGGFGGGNAYASTDGRRPESKEFRVTSGTSSQTLVPSLDQLIAQGRDLDRSHPKAKALVEGYRADVIGTGIGIQPRTGDAALDSALLSAFELWAERAGILGETLYELQGQAAGDIFLAGASLWRWISVPGEAGVPLRLAALEVEWLSPEPVGPITPGCDFIRGIDIDTLGRPRAYHLRNPETQQTEHVAASQIIHCYIRRRARQVHGEPEAASLLIRLWQDNEIVSTELRAAKNNSNIAGILKTPDADLTADNDSTERRHAALQIAPGQIQTIGQDEDFITVENKRLSAGIGDFRHTIDGDLAAGAGVSRQWLDRDSSRANYSSMREDGLRDQRRLAPARLCLGRHLAGRVYETIAPFLFLSLGRILPSDPATRARLLRYEQRPDQPPYVDPLKDAQALAYQLEKDLITEDEVHAARGRSADDMRKARLAERQMADAAQVERIKQLDKIVKASGVEGLHWSHLVTLGGANTAPGAYLQGAQPQPQPEAPRHHLTLERDAAGRLIGLRPALASDD